MADADLYYADCRIPYRGAATAGLLPEQQKHGLSDIPQRPGIATPVAKMTEQDRITVPVLDGRKVLASGEALSLEDQGWTHVWHRSAMDATHFYEQSAVLNDYFPEVCTHKPAKLRASLY